jgi:hypothetical protein
MASQVRLNAGCEKRLERMFRLCFLGWSERDFYVGNSSLSLG